jgi:hypothetical protein
MVQKRSHDSRFLSENPLYKLFDLAIFKIFVEA